MRAMDQRRRVRGHDSRRRDQHGSTAAHYEHSGDDEHGDNERVRGETRTRATRATDQQANDGSKPDDDHDTSVVVDALDDRCARAALDDGRATRAVVARSAERAGDHYDDEQKE